MELLEFRVLSHCLSYAFPKGEKEHNIRLAGNAWKLSGHPVQYQKQNKKNFTNTKNRSFNFPWPPPMIFAYLLSLFSILDVAERGKVVMQADFLKGT